MKTHIVSLINICAARVAMSGVWLVMAALLVAGVSGGRASSEEPIYGRDSLPQGVITNATRTVLGNDVAHYTYDVRLGPGDFEVIRLHRIVRERSLNRPIVAVDSLFMLTGAPNTFEGLYMAPSVSPVLDWDQSIVAFFAKNDVDVWGMDFGWALVPAGTTDFGFMQGWGLARELRDVDAALRIAQAMRRATGQGSGRMHLLGMSYGASVAYAVAAEETQKPYGLRKIKGIIPVDNMLKTDVEAVRIGFCNGATTGLARLAAGIYQNPSGANLKLYADLASSLPDEQSPFVPAFTNLQFFLLAMTTGNPSHFAGGTTAGLYYSDLQVLLDVARNAPPYTPVQMWVDINSTGCGESDVPFDDHVGEIAIPILYVGAAGGNGGLGLYTLALTSSDDVTINIVQLLDDASRAVDFGHVDLILARDADTLVWTPILNWINEHVSPSPVQSP